MFCIILTLKAFFKTQDISSVYQCVNSSCSQQYLIQRVTTSCLLMRFSMINNVILLKHVHYEKHKQRCICGPLFKFLLLPECQTLRLTFWDYSPSFEINHNGIQSRLPSLHHLLWVMPLSKYNHSLQADYSQIWSLYSPLFDILQTKVPLVKVKELFRSKSVLWSESVLVLCLCCWIF